MSRGRAREESAAFAFSSPPKNFTTLFLLRKWLHVLSHTMLRASKIFFPLVDDATLSVCALIPQCIIFHPSVCAMESHSHGWGHGGFNPHT